MRAMLLPARRRLRRPPAATGPNHPQDQRRDMGETLIELLFTMMILGIGVSAITTSVLIGLRASGQVKAHSKVMAALRTYGEALSNVTDSGGTNPYRACAVPQSAAGTNKYPTTTALGVLSPTGITMSVTAVAYWNGAAYASTCPSPELGLERLTLTASAASGGYPQVVGTLNVYVRKPCLVTTPC